MGNSIDMLDMLTLSYCDIYRQNGQMIGFLEIIADENLWRVDDSGACLFQGCPANIIRERAAELLKRITTTQCEELNGA